MVLSAIAHASHIPARPRIRPEIPEAVEHDIVRLTAANQGITVIAVAEEAMGLIRQFHDGSVRIRVSDQIGAAGRNGGTVAEGVPVIMSTFNISSIAGVGEGVIRQGNRSLRGVENLQIFVVTAAFGVFGEKQRAQAVSAWRGLGNTLKKGILSKYHPFAVVRGCTACSRPVAVALDMG